MKITLSKKQWEFLGKKAGCVKSAGGIGKLGGDASDVMEGIVLKNKSSPLHTILDMVKKDSFLQSEIFSSDISDEELVSCIQSILKIYKLS